MQNWIGSVINNYWIIVWLSPFIWSLVLLLDVYQTNEVFQDRWDGSIISSLFMIIPIIVLPITSDLAIQTSKSAFFAISSGALISMASFYYFSALKHKDDAVFAESINTIAILLVPLFSFVLFGAKYDYFGVIAICLAFLNGLIFAVEPSLFNGAEKKDFFHNKAHWRAFKAMLISTFFLALSVVLADRAYEDFDYSTCLFLISLGCVSTGIIMWVLSPSIVEKSDNVKRIGIISLIKCNWKIFTISEIMAVMATVSFQRALELGNATLTFIVDSTVPIIVMVLSVLIVSFGSLKGTIAHSIATRQLHNPFIKVIACIGMLLSLILAGTYISQ